MAETTNDVVLNEGSTAVKIEGIKASATVTVINNVFDSAEELIVNGVTLTEGVEWNEGGDADLTAADIALAINNSSNVLIKGILNATSLTNVVTIKALDPGTDGNLLTLTESNVGATDNLALSGALFTGGILCQGVYVAEESGDDFVATLEEGLEFNPVRETLERDVRTSTTESLPSRIGIKSANGTIPIELKAGSTEGSLPEWNALMLSTLGAKRRSVNSVTSEAGHTSTVINIGAADIGKFKFGDIIKLKKIGILDQDHISPLSAVDTTAETITLLVPATDISGAAISVPDNAIIAPFTTYFIDSSKAPSVSVTNYVGGVLREKILGLRATTLEINNITTGQTANMSFALEGTNFEKEVGTPLFTPIFDTSVPPVMLDAKIFQDGLEILVNTMTMSFANTVGFKTAFGDPNGRIGSRITDVALTGAIDPYVIDNSVSNFDLFNANSKFSIFQRAFNPTAVAGIKDEIFAVFIPNCRITELGTGDQEGLATDAISFSGHRTNGNDTLFIGVI